MSHKKMIREAIEKEKMRQLTRKLEDKLQVIADMDPTDKDDLIKLEESTLVVALQNLYEGKHPEFIDDRSKIGGGGGTYIDLEDRRGTDK